MHVHVELVEPVEPVKPIVLGKAPAQVSVQAAQEVMVFRSAVDRVLNRMIARRPCLTFGMGSEGAVIVSRLEIWLKQP